jgi:lysophospholipase L1-like esterase
MKKIFLLSLQLIFSFIMMSMIHTKKTRIVFFGDSITQMGINKGGYIDRMQNAINEKEIQNKYELIGAGVGYDKIYDLFLRMEDDVLAKKPDVVVIYEGVNDVGHKYSTRTGTDIEKYERFYKAIIKKLQAQHIKVFVCTPALLGEKKDNANPQDAEIDAYSDIIRKLATAMNCTLIDLRKTFLNYLQINNGTNKEYGILTTDRIHPSDTGNQLLADEMMKALHIQ